MLYIIPARTRPFLTTVWTGILINKNEDKVWFVCRRIFIFAMYSSIYLIISKSMINSANVILYTDNK